MSKQDYTLLIIKSFTNDLTKKERQFLDDWLGERTGNQKLYNELQSSWEKSDAYKNDTIVDMDAAWKNVRSKIAKKQSSKVVPLWRQTRMRIVASLLLAIGIGALFLNQGKNSGQQIAQMTFTTLENETKVLDLPDGSIVTLNENSSVQYNEPFKKRNIDLQGEAHFVVAHDANHPFNVAAGPTQTTVLGTKFFISLSSDNDVKVFLEEGSVAFTNHREKIILKPGEEANYNNTSYKINKAFSSDANILAWQTKELKFEESNITDVINDLEKYFNKEITLSTPTNSNCSFTGSFKDPTFKDVIEILSFTYDMNVIEEGNKTFFEIKQCQ